MKIHFYVVIAAGAQISSQHSSSSRPVCLLSAAPCLHYPSRAESRGEYGRTEREDELSQDNKVIKAINVVYKLIIHNQN